MTYSLIARDHETGALGVAVASHAFAVGRDVAFGRNGVGVVATQGVPEPGQAERLLDALEGGATADAALAELVQSDAGALLKQTAVLGAAGAPAAHTGMFCVPFAGHQVSDDHAAQGNLLANGGIWEVVSAAYAEAQGPFALRLLDGLEAGLQAGGDLRGQQSAALLIVSDSLGGRPIAEFRVDDHPEPLTELRRLLRMDQADLLLQRGRAVVMGAPGEPEHALQLLREAQLVFGDGNREPDFWSAVIAERLEGADRFPETEQWQELRLRLQQMFGPAQ